MMASLQTNFNTSPVWDDYDPTKQFYRILFRPTVAVQARELTQLQTISQNQIQQFGSWAFNNGDIVNGCSISDIPNLPFIRINDFASNSTSNNVSLVANTLVNTYVTSATSNLTARVLYANNGLLANYPATNILYLQYLNTGITGQTNFSNNELLLVSSVSTNSTIQVCNVYSIANTSNNIAFGNARAVSVSGGTIFIDGFFVLVENNTLGIVNAYSTSAGNNVVGFQLTENIITENQDSSLYDNALGYSNYNAPGAWRLQLQPYLISLDPSVVNSNTFNPIAVYNSNNLILKTSSANTLQSQIGDAVASCVYDEAGNYVISPFSVDTVSISGNATYMNARVQPGIGYAQGYKINLLKTAYVSVRRGTDQSISYEQQITANYGNYLSLTQVAGNFDFDRYQTVTLYDTAQNSISNHEWASISPIGNVLGTAQVREFEYSSGIPGTSTAVYNLYLFNIIMNSGASFSSVNSVYFNNGGVIGVGDVQNSVLQQSGPQTLLFGFGTDALFSLKDQNNNNNAEYTYRKKSTGLQLSANGQITIAITSSAAGGTDILPYGVSILPDSRILSDIIVIPQSNISMTITNSNVNISNTSNSIIGNSTTFLTDISVGESIQVGNVIRTVTSISNNNYLNIDSPFTTTASNQTYTKWYQAGRYVPIGSTYVGNRGVYVSNSSTMTISTGIVPSNTSFATVYYDILRTNLSPIIKTINKNVFVTIDTTVNPNGPWCLGFKDVHQLDAVYGSASNTYSINGINLTNSFLLDNGQRDDHYDLAWLYPNGSINLSGNPYLTVQLDYFTSNTSSGVGLFTVDSYPIDNANTSNTNAITTVNFPIYTTSSGSQIPLRDVVDFRPLVNSTSNNTGSVNMTNAASVATAISYATHNPSSNGVLYVSTTGTYTPSVGTNFQSDIQYYLPRKDMFYFSPTGALKIKEGAPSLAPQSPLAPETGMPVAILNISPFPSLTTDQLDSVTEINQTALKLIRESDNPVLINLITNRRYTMQDIGTLDTRITNLEQLLSLTLLESSASQLTITNSQGQNAFKNGIFADPFTSHALGDVSNQEYRIAIDTQNAVARPFINRTRVPIIYNANTSTAQKTGRAITLPYTQTILVSQPYSTEYMSAAPVAFHWNGTCLLFPSYTNNENVVNTGSIQVTINNATAWQQFAASPFGTIYGDWNTTSNTVQTVTVSGAVANVVKNNTTTSINVNYTSNADLSFVQNNNYWIREAASYQGINLPKNFVIGKVTYTGAAPGAINI